VQDAESIAVWTSNYAGGVTSGHALHMRRAH